MDLSKQLVAIDQRIVDKLELFCHSQQRLLGTSHYSWLKFFAVSHAIFYTFLLPIRTPSEQIVGWLLIVACLACIPGFIWWEKKSLNRRLKGFVNPLRKNERAIFIRYLIGYFATTYFFVVLTIAILINPENLWGSLALIVWWTTLASLYVLPVCDPLPPTTGKWREWVTVIFLKPVRL